MRPIRRQERKTTEAEALEILSRCAVCHLAMVDGDRPYVVPLSFGLAREGDRNAIYFHAAAEGRKLEILAKNPRVCFEAVAEHHVVESEIACGHTMGYESVIGGGVVEVLDGEQDKRRGLTAVMANYSARTDFIFPKEALARTCVLRLEIEELTGKRNKK